MTDPSGYYHYTKTENGQTICKKQKVNFRFMGLWDTVLSDNWAPYSYQLGIPDDFAYVAQAVALNEFRGHTHPFGRALPPYDRHAWGSFPLESIMGGPVPASQTRIERGFIGAHADIGGGFGPGENQLAQVALVWMVNQAKAAGVAMTDDPKLHTIIANPVIHDKSDAIRFGSPVSGTASSGDANWNDWNPGYSTGPSAGTGAEDRQVRYRDGAGVITSTTTQRQMTGTGMTFADTENADPDKSIITYDATRSRPDNVTGTVNMEKYLKWLNDNGYGLTNLTVQ
jgi:hypothetical protein